MSSITTFRESLCDEIYSVEHDTDMDGFASGIITALALRRMGFDARPFAVERSETFVPDSGAVVLTDLAINNEVTCCVDSALQKGVRVYAIDHHPWTHGYDRKIQGAVNPHILPNVPQPSKWNTGFLAYLIFKDVVPDYDWLAAISVYTDMCVAPWSEHLIDRFGRDNVERAGDMLTAFIATNEDISELDQILLDEIRNIQDVLKDQRFIEAERSFESAVEKYVEDPESHTVLWDEKKKLAVIETEEPYSQMKSVVSTRLSLKPEFRDWVIAVIGKDPDAEGYKISIRCQGWEKRTDIGKLAGELAEKLGGAGGGHPAAAGMRIPKDKKDAFVDLLHSSL